MTGDSVPFSEARANQAQRLGEAIRAVTAAVADLGAAGGLSGPGPIFAGIGASHAAACAPVWTLRARGIHSWRLAAGDYPLPFPRSDHPVIGGITERPQRGDAGRAGICRTRPALRRREPDAVPYRGHREDHHRHREHPDSYASTVGYTATVAALGILADSWDGGAIDPGWQDMAAVVHETEQLLTEPVRRLAAGFTRARSADFVGAGPSVGSAEAAALLFREVARVPSTGMGTRQYLHGSMESAGDSVHVLFGDTRETEVATTLAAAGHQVILVTSQDVAPGRNLEIVRLPARPPAQRVILEALAMQILVAAVAEQRAIEIEEFIFHNSDTKVPAGSARE